MMRPPLAAAARARAAAPSVDVGGRGVSSAAKGRVSRPLASATSAPFGPGARKVAPNSSAPASMSGRKLVS